MPETLRPRSRARLTLLLVIGLVLPVVAAATAVWTTQDRQQHLERVPVAIVNSDKILSDPQPMAAGRALAASLTDPENADPVLDWQLTEEEDAKAGLARGTYYGVLTIPSDFSSAIVSTGTDTPVRGQLSLVSNAAASATVPYISQQVVAAAAATLGNQSTQGYLKNVYAGFNKIASSNKSAASSAGSLADGTAELSQGADQLSTGAGTLAGSLGELASGAVQLQTGTASLRSGSARLARGSSQLSVGARRMQAGERELARSARELARGTRSVAAGARGLAGGAGRLAASTAQLERGNGILALEMRLAARRCPAAGGSLLFCAALERLAEQSLRLYEGAGAVSAGAAGVARSSTALAGGAGRLASASSKLAGGAESVASSGAELAGSAERLDSGARSVSTGAVSVDEGASALAGGAGSAAQAGSSLASGSESLSSSAAQVDGGADSLSSGLTKEAKQSPTYSDSQQSALEDTVSQPIRLSASTQHSTGTNGWLVALFAGLILWLCALATTFARDPAAVLAHAGGPVSSWRLALAATLPLVALALVQGAVVVVTIRVLGIDLTGAASFTVLCLVAAVCFLLVTLALRLTFARAGIALAVLFLVIQLASLANVVPLETAPRLLQVCNTLLPLPAFADAASQLVSGGSVHSVWQALAVLVAWGAGAHVLAVSALRRRRLHHPAQARTGGAGVLAAV